jgi:hypothetical protein
MKARPIIPTLLLALSLLALTAGTACSLLESGSEQKQSKSGAARNPQDASGAKPTQQELENANAKLVQAEREAKNFNDNLRQARENETKATAKEKDRAHQTVVDTETAANKANTNLAAANANVRELQSRLNEDKGAGANGGNANQQGSISEGGLLSYLPGLFTVLLVFCSLLILAGLIYIAKQLIDGSRARADGHFASVKKRQDEYARQTREAVAALDKSVNSRLAALQSEIKELRLTLQDDNRAILDGVRRAGASSAAYAGSSSGYVAQPARFEREEPAFPAAAEEYLNRSRRGAVVVKPDFQNGMLVQDTEGTGEFMLVRDYAAPDELLYVVPRIGYFQTKQDFYNYYDRYYECARPAAGTVWIVQPAVVDRVSGGWTLREKGELEVR